MKIFFAKSNEDNGSRALGKFFEAYGHGWNYVDGYIGLVSQLMMKRTKIQLIFTPSDMHFAFSHAICRILAINVPIILGFYHPRGWDAMCDYEFCSARAKMMKKIIDEISPENIIFPSAPSIKGCEKYINDAARRNKLYSNIAVVPLLESGALNKLYSGSKLSGKCTKIVTVGRLVPFKISSIIAIARVIDKMISEGLTLTYTIYGDGPSRTHLAKEFAKLKNKNNFSINGSIPSNEFAKKCIDYDIFFGMGTAVVRAANVGLISIVAIQGNSKSTCYGLFSDHNHFENPTYGDQDDTLEAVDMKSCLEHILAFEDPQDLARMSRQASEAYLTDRALEKMEKLFSNAVARQIKINVFQLVNVRIALAVSRRMGRKEIDT